MPTKPEKSGATHVLRSTDALPAAGTGTALVAALPAVGAAGAATVVATGPSDSVPVKGTVTWEPSGWV
ncbi:MAG: hypothetical protein NUV65_00200 [Candidatus Roizmanbacteria bacterium]|nr:hypothetical protein [Candidatus Roizmanbacteria bacterium]